LVSKYLNNGYGLDNTIELQWKNLPNYVSPFNGLVVADVSGSMSGRPIEVSISLALYIAERNEGHFKNRFFTFSNRPILQTIVGNTLCDRVSNLRRAHWDMNTNIQALFDTLLNVAVKNELPQSELPERLFIVSDMQFDMACTNNSNTNFEFAKKKFEKHGYNLPQLIFWNVNARNSSDCPVTIHDTGTALVSGCSPSILKSVLENKIITPLDVMNSAIESERYDVIRYE
jgi:hypothetical protein